MACVIVFISTNPIANLFTTELLVCKQHAPTANLNIFSKGFDINILIVAVGCVVVYKCVFQL